MVSSYVSVGLGCIPRSVGQADHDDHLLGDASWVIHSTSSFPSQDPSSKSCHCNVLQPSSSGSDSPGVHESCVYLDALDIR